MNTFQNLKYKYNNLNVFGKIITVNIIIFLLSVLLKRILKLGIVGYFELPPDFGDFIFQPWSLITYGFLHSGIWHVVFNMLFLFYLTNTACNLFRTKMVLNIYLLGIICGGLAFLSVANILPFVIPVSGYGNLVGASAGVAALLMFIAVYMPDSQIRLFNTFNVKWMHIAIFFLTIDVIRLVSGMNQGGVVAHMGGYLLGYAYALNLKKGKDIGTSFERLMDSVASWFKPKSKLKTVHKTRPTKTTINQKQKDTSDKQKQIDAILDKISKSGYDSLTAKEKKFLFEASKED
ncbi:rhomboid family intramembrane serine protease [Winogradskyella tangerina]|uniref:rhomboid family intramembrane serine protease n=1 Tax=Winogradskyella tangerina TaxID=2023240 RepID=UPI000DBE35BE|nr:rhomboid family intramembrane serine protease [Winogradskyella tangerina]